MFKERIILSQYFLINVTLTYKSEHVKHNIYHISDSCIFSGSLNDPTLNVMRVKTLFVS